MEKFLLDVPDPVCVLLDDDLLALQPIYVYLHIWGCVCTLASMKRRRKSKRMASLSFPDGKNATPRRV